MLRRTYLRLAAVEVQPPSVLVLTMTLNGGALTPALRELGYHPYTFETTFRQGHIVNHPREWLAVLDHHKAFDPVILARAPDDAKTASSSVSPDVLQYDALVGPPATLAFESILRVCPLSTRVVLVEEPDKAEWESHMSLILQQVRHETRRLRLLGNARQLSALIDAMTDIRKALGQRRERHARQQKVLAGRPLHNMSQGSALNLFEDHVREVVPRDRLLVYRLGDGWEPLCAFLGKPVPLDSTPVSSAAASVPSSAPASSSTAVATAQVLPFPVNTDGLEVLSTLSSATNQSHLLMLVFVLSVAGLVTILLTPAVSRLRELYVDEQEQYLESVQPYVDQGKETGDVSIRRMLVLSKKATIDHQKQYQEDGTAAHQWWSTWKRILGLNSEGK